MSASSARPTCAAALLACGVFAACGADPEAKAAAAQAGPPPAVVVATVEQRPIRLRRDFVARTEAVETVEVTARVEAVLESMEFAEGAPVTAGQVLYHLDPRTYEAAVSSAQAAVLKAEADVKLAREQVSVRAAEATLAQSKARLVKAEQDVERLEPLAERDAVPRQDLDTAYAAREVAKAEVDASEANLTNSKIVEEVGVKQAEAELQSAQARLAQAQLDLEYCTITSPIDGLIGRTLVTTGNLVGRGAATTLATVSRIDPIYVTFAISEEEYLGLQRTNDPESKPLEERPRNLELILADGSVYEHKGRFFAAERAVELETGTLQVVCEFPNPDGFLRPGQFGRVRVQMAELPDALLVPQRAVQQQLSARVVLVVGEGDVVQLRTVQLGARFEHSYVVLDGLEAGDRVIVEGQLKARPGSKVVPKDAPASSEPAGDEG
jgi:membrane fusion protein (multidrug efflux system)